MVAKILDGTFADIEPSPGDDDLQAKKDEVETVQTEIVSEIESIGESIASATSAVESFTIGPPSSSSSSSSSSAEVMNIVMQQVSILLDTTNVPTDVPLMDMDLHSFGSADLAARLSIVFNLKLVPAFLYDYPTIEEIVTFITEELHKLREDEENNFHDNLEDIVVAEEEEKLEEEYHRGEKRGIQSSPSPSTPQKSTSVIMRTPSRKSDSIKLSSENPGGSPYTASYKAVRTPPSESVRTPSSKSERTPSGKSDSRRLSSKCLQGSPFFEFNRKEYIFIGDNFITTDAMSGLCLYKKKQSYNDLEFINAMESALATILDLNPILTGCIVKKTHSVTGQNGFLVEPKYFQLEDGFKVIHMEVDKSFKVPSDERDMAMFITGTCDPFITRLGTGLSQMKNKSPLFSFTVINLPDNKHVVLQFSMSHAIADGYTVSKIMSQLNQSLQDKVITPLRWDVPTTFIVDKRIYSLLEKIVIFVWVNIFKVLDDLFLSLWSSSSRAGTNYVIVNNTAVEKIRNQIRSSSNQFVSDNDIILSALSKKLHKSWVAYLCNMRCHVDGITADLAGNWVELLVMNRKCCADPSGVRSLSSMHDVFKRPALLDFANFLQPGVILNTNITGFDMSIHFPSQVEFICFIPTVDGMRRQPCCRNTVTFMLNSGTTMILCGCHKTYRELLAKSGCDNGDPYDEIFMLSNANNGSDRRS